MRKRYSAILLPAVILLFVGSSGCESSDVLDVMEILGGSQGITATDVIQKNAPKAFGGGSTGDKDKDGLLDTADTLDAIKKADDLAELAQESVAKDPPDYKEANKKLEEALTLRPKDLSLIEQKAVLLAEQGDPNATKTAANCAGVPEDQVDRCFRYTLRQRSVLLESSISRQKGLGSLISCETAEFARRHYGYIGNMTNDEAEGMRIDEEEWRASRALASHYQALTKSPGSTCATPKPPA